MRQFLIYTLMAIFASGLIACAGLPGFNGGEKGDSHTSPTIPKPVIVAPPPPPPPPPLDVPTAPPKKPDPKAEQPNTNGAVNAFSVLNLWLLSKSSTSSTILESKFSAEAIKNRNVKYRDIHDYLIAELRAAEYSEFKKFTLPSPRNGFAIATRLEAIDGKGKPASKDESRFIEDDDLKHWNSISDLIANLVGARKVHYRVLLFVISGEAIGTKTGNTDLSGDVIGDLKDGGADLPKEVMELVVDSAPHCTLYVYEFKKFKKPQSHSSKKIDTKPVFYFKHVPYGKSISFKAHLQNTQLEKALK